MRILLASLLAALLPSLAVAQSVLGAISGTVTDAARAPLAGALVRLVDVGTNRVRSCVADTRGEFTVSSLPPGEYRIEAEHEGYRRHVRQLTLGLNQEIQVDVPLLPGRRTDTVEVRAAPELLRTDSSSLGGLIENRQITGLPLDGRNFFELSLLLPGVAPPAPGSAGSIRGDFAVNVNGAREDSNSFLLDGVFNGDPQLNHIGVTPPLDAVREFEVVLGAYDASFGRNAGGQVNVILKSGTNQFHGAGYGFLRNRALDARNYFAPPAEKSPRYQRNQWGGSLGGPAVRDRTFFFADYEGRRLREGMTRVTNVPTELERAGDFSRSSMLAIDLFTQRPFEGNVIPLARRHPVGLAVANLYPLPNRSAPGQNYVSSPAARDREDHFDVRLDHNLGASDDLGFRYSFADRALYEPFSGPTFAAVPGFGTNVERRAQNAVLSETHVFAPSWLNELRLGFNRISIGTFHENQGRNRNAEVGLPQVSANPRAHGLSFISITGYSPLGDESHNPQHSSRTGYQIVDTATHVRGRHILKAGVDVRWLQQNAYRDEMARGFINFLGRTGNALAEMLQGFPSLSGAARLDNHQHMRTRSAYFFLQDTW
ncbi:MAG TPA: carboxypeptidase regulatory-like domain-containing protein, partial [Bryobacteraceae bacterium]|nr:carboxypeptidase regulatory-like domain-containing protein [Bryobacteraceae bacterium]